MNNPGYPYSINEFDPCKFRKNHEALLSGQFLLFQSLINIFAPFSWNCANATFHDNVRALSKPFKI